MSNNGCSVSDYLFPKECNFSQIKSFTICPFNEWSDHAPLHFSLNCNNIPRGGLYYSETRYKWDSTFREEFRSRLISQLPLFNTIVNTTDYLSRDSVNNMLLLFTNSIRDIADPLFSKECIFKDQVAFENYTSSNKEWFDSECIDARNLYLDALRCFNTDKTFNNRKVLCERKKEYKNIVRKKKCCDYKRRMDKITELRKSKPSEF